MDLALREVIFMIETHKEREKEKEKERRVGRGGVSKSLLWGLPKRRHKLFERLPTIYSIIFIILWIFKFLTLACKFKLHIPKKEKSNYKFSFFKFQVYIYFIKLSIVSITY